MALLDVIQFVGAMGFVVSLAPQLIRTLQRRNAQDVSLWFLIILLASSALLLYFSLAMRLIWFAVSYSTNLVVWSIVLYFRVHPGGERSGSG